MVENIGKSPKQAFFKTPPTTLYLSSTKPSLGVGCGVYLFKLVMMIFNPLAAYTLYALYPLSYTHIEYKEMIPPPPTYSVYTKRVKI